MARAFDGTGDKVVYTDDSALHVASGDFSIVAWSYRTATTGYMVLFDKPGTPQRELSWFFTGADGFYFGVGGTDVYGATASWGLNTWNHLAAIRSGTTLKLYKNGSEFASVASSGTDVSTNSDLAIGQNASGGGADYAGNIAEFAIYNVAISVSDVLSMAAGFSPPLVRRAGGVLYAPLIGQSAEPDLWGGRSGTVTNATIASHPRVIYPRRKQVVVASAAAAATTFGFLRDNAGVGAMGGGPFSRANAGLGVLA